MLEPLGLFIPVATDGGLAAWAKIKAKEQAQSEQAEALASEASSTAPGISRKEREMRQWIESYKLFCTLWTGREDDAIGNDHPLQDWVTRQRKQAKTGTLAAWRREMLDKIVFPYIASRKEAGARCSKIKPVKEEVSANKEPSQELPFWMKPVRQSQAATRPWPKMVSAGDKTSRWYQDAVELNEWAAGEIAKGRIILVKGEEYMPMKFTGVECSKREFHGVCVTYISEGSRCGAYIRGRSILHITRALMSRGKYSMMDTDEEPLSIEVS